MTVQDGTDNRTKILRLVEGIGLKPVDGVTSGGCGDRSYYAIEIENALGRAWAVLITHPRVFWKDDLIFMSKPPSTAFKSEITLMYGFIHLWNIEDVDDAKYKFAVERDGWDHSYLASVVTL
jgi:hypothetical protein